MDSVMATKSVEPWFVDPIYGLPVGTLVADDRRLLLPQLPGHVTKVVDPTLTFAGLLLDPKFVAIARMQQLRLLQQSYLISGHPPPNFALFPEPLLPSSDLDLFWQTKHHPDYHHLFPSTSSTSSAWMLPPWCLERSSPGSTGLRYPPGENRRLGPDQNAGEESGGGKRGVQGPSEPAVEREIDRLDHLPNSVRKCKQVYVG